jgi:hypothetical protein
VIALSFKQLPSCEISVNADRFNLFTLRKNLRDEKIECYMFQLKTTLKSVQLTQLGNQPVNFVSRLKLCGIVFRLFLPQSGSDVL